MHPLNDGFATTCKSGAASRRASSDFTSCLIVQEDSEALGSVRELTGGGGKHKRACLAAASDIMQRFVTRSHILVSLLAHDIGTSAGIELRLQSGLSFVAQESWRVAT